jgi:hypothetical protein
MFMMKLNYSVLLSMDVRAAGFPVAKLKKCWDEMLPG